MLIKFKWELVVISGIMFVLLPTIRFKMKTLKGEHICRMDAKGRFLLPGGLKNQLAEVFDQGFIIKKSTFSPCLELYPRQSWDELYQKVTLKLNRFKKEHNDFIRAFNAGLREVDADNAGRVLVPRDLAVETALTADIVLAAKMGCIEIWDKARYDADVAATQQNLSTMAENIFGDINLNE